MRILPRRRLLWVLALLSGISAPAGAATVTITIDCWQQFLNPCVVCGISGDYSCSNFPGWTFLPSCAFPDPVPGGNTLYQIDVTLNGTGCALAGGGCTGTCCALGTYSTDVNGTTCGGGAYGYNCTCPSCTPFTSSSSNYPCGFPGYIYGGSNTFTFNTCSTYCLSTVTLVFTYGGPCFSPTPTDTETPNSTPTETATGTSSATRTATRTRTISRTPTATRTISSTASESPSPTESQTSTETISASATATESGTPTASPTASASISVTVTPTRTDSPSVTPTATHTYSVTACFTATGTVTPTGTQTATSNATPTRTSTPSPSPICAGPYPNPFHPDSDPPAVIPLCTDKRVVVTVFTLAGHSARTLPGSAIFEAFGYALWDGKDDRDLPAASGFYVVRVSSTNGVRVMKITLLR